MQIWHVACRKRARIASVALAKMCIPAVTSSSQVAATRVESIYLQAIRRGSIRQPYLSSQHGRLLS